MTAKSAYEQYEKRQSRSGYCLPLSLDSILKVSTLPDEYYDLFYEASRDPNASYNKTAGYLLKNFFGVEPQPDAGLPAVGKFTAYGGSPQTYMPDAPYDYPEEAEIQELGVTPKQIRFVELLKIARDNSCNVLFTNNQEGNEHVCSLDLIDVGTTPISALYIVRDMGIIQDKNTTYSPADLSGILQTYGIAGTTTRFTPLPTVQRSYFPEGQASYELVIFPADPKI